MTPPARLRGWSTWVSNTTFWRRPWWVSWHSVWCACFACSAARRGTACPGLTAEWYPPGRHLVARPCQGRGYRGRIGIFELLEVDDPIREIISQQGPARRVAEVARSGGMRSLQEDGWDKVEQGLTSVQEVLAATQDS